MVLLDATLYLILSVPLRPPAPSAARLAQIMVPTWGGPCRASIGRPSRKARWRFVDAAPTLPAARALEPQNCPTNASPTIGRNWSWTSVGWC